jgi:AcrR family transcriptional regulator
VFLPRAAASRRYYDLSIDDIAISAPADLGRRERNKADKWERILLAAAKLFNERGFAATTTTEVAKTAGIGTGTLFLYVRTKEELFVEVFRSDVGSAWDDAFASVDPEASLLDQLCRAFFTVIEHHDHNPGLARAFLTELHLLPDDMRSDARVFMRGYMVRLRQFLVDAQTHQRLDDGVNVTVLSTNLFAVYQWHLQLHVAGHSTRQECFDDLRAAFELQVEHLSRLQP